MIWVTFFGLIAILIASLVWGRDFYGLNEIGFSGVFISSLLIIVLGLALIIGPYKSERKMLQYLDLQDRYTQARETGDINSLEWAAMRSKATEYNEWRIGAQYWADGFFGPTYADGIMDLSPIE